MLDYHGNLSLRTKIARVVHLHRNRHIARKYHYALKLGKPPATREKILLSSHPRQRMIGAYGSTDCTHSQTWQPQLGASRSARAGSRN